MSTADLAPEQLAILLSLLPANDPLVVAARLGLEMGELRAQHRGHIREAGHDVHGGKRMAWRDLATNHVPFDELQRRRAVPGPMAAERRTA